LANRSKLSGRLSDIDEPVVSSPNSDHPMMKTHAKMGKHLMSVRTSRKTVTFTRPFSLSGIDELQPAGSYTVETDEEELPGLSFPAYRRIATLILLRSQCAGRVVEEVVDIDPLELHAAQERDAGRHTLADYHGTYLGRSNGLMN
jgi:hypothetical protein